MYKITSSGLTATAQIYIELLWVVLWKYQGQPLVERQVAGTTYWQGNRKRTTKHHYPSVSTHDSQFTPTLTAAEQFRSL